MNTDSEYSNNNVRDNSIDLNQTENECQHELLQKFHELDKGKKLKLYLTSLHFKYYSHYLNLNDDSDISVIPRSVRAFILNLINSLEADKYSDLRNILERPTDEGRYIHRKFKEMMAAIFQRWSDILLNVDTEEENKYYLKNGFFNPTFIQLMHNIGIEHFKRYTGTGSFIVDTFGEVDKDLFYQLLSNYDPECEVLVRYEYFKRRDEFKFGDPYSVCFVHDISKGFPFQLQEAVHSAGRGTAGCFVRIGSGLILHDCLLTCAHVAYSSLSEANPDIINKFNNFCVYGSYEREKIHNDYAILPCNGQFLSLDCDIFNTLVGKNMCRLNHLVDFWKKICLLPPDIDLYTYKRGITTGITKGLFSGYHSSDGTIMINQFEDQMFSDGGDSGALVFLEDVDDNCLYPIALHFSRLGSVSYSIPLWRIFWSFCKKHGLQEVMLDFVSPRLEGKGKVRFVADEFDGCSVNGLFVS